MQNACYTPIYICLSDTSLHFYTFSDTNLLTRCHSASSMFSAVLYFRKVVQEIFSDLDEIKAEVAILLKRRRSSEERWRGPGAGHTMPLGSPGPGRAKGWCGHLLALLHLCFGLRLRVGKNRRFGFCFVQFRAYFLYNFFEIQKLQKTGTDTMTSC